MAFSTKIKGNHNLQGNVQVFHVRIPAIVSAKRVKPSIPSQGQECVRAKLLGACWTKRPFVSLDDDLGFLGLMEAGVHIREISIT